LIIIIDTHLLYRGCGITKRFFTNKLNNIGRTEEFKDLIGMLKWNYEYERKIKLEVLNFTKKFQHKRQIVSNSNEALSFFKI